jgi:uncharacterized protein (UPF0335 family)
MTSDVGGIAGDRLRSFIERIERLEIEKQALAEDIKEVFAEAKGTGFDTKTMRQIIKLRKMSADERDEAEALLDLYKAALGMLSDTPLGEAAIRRITRKPPAPAPEESGAPAAAAPEPSLPNEPQDTVDDARARGREAALAGKPVTANPYPARDKRRAAWDEAWCASSGSDGMEIPEFLRRAGKKPRPGEGEHPQAA